MTVRRKERSRRIKHETDKYEKISGSSRFLCCRSGRKLIFISGIRKQVFPGTAYGEYSLCGPLGTGIRTGRGIRGGTDPESSGTWKPDGLPGQYVRRADLRACVSEDTEYSGDTDR